LEILTLGAEPANRLRAQAQNTGATHSGSKHRLVDRHSFFLGAGICILPFRLISSVHLHTSYVEDYDPYREGLTTHAAPKRREHRALLRFMILLGHFAYIGWSVGICCWRLD